MGQSIQALSYIYLRKSCDTFFYLSPLFYSFNMHIIAGCKTIGLVFTIY